MRSKFKDSDIPYWYVIFSSYFFYSIVPLRPHLYINITDIDYIHISIFSTGNSGYPLEPWLLTPLPHEPEGTPRFQYNEALCSARDYVERMFGVLKSTWRCLSKHRVLQYKPGFAGRIVNACAVFHNMRHAHDLLDDPLGGPLVQ